MSRFEYDSASMYFEHHGSGFPLLLIAPGAMNSTVENVVQRHGKSVGALPGQVPDGRYARVA